MSEANHMPLPVKANPGDGRIFDADGKIICWMGGAGLFEESEILARRDELIISVNARPKVEELVRDLIRGLRKYPEYIMTTHGARVLLTKASEVEAALRGEKA